MIYEEFLLDLAKWGKGKFSRQNGALRTSTGCCPVEYVYARKKHRSLRECQGKALVLVTKLGLNPSLGKRIMSASDARQDFRVSHFDKSIWIDIALATGLLKPNERGQQRIDYWRKKVEEVNSSTVL